MSTVSDVTRSTSTIGTDYATTETFSAKSRHDESFTLLPGRSDVGSIMNVVLLLERCLDAQRKAASERRDAAEASQTRKDAESVAKIREEADDIFKQGMVSGLTSVAVGAVQVTGAGMNLHSTGLQADATTAKTAAEQAAKQAGEQGKLVQQKAAEAARLSERATKIKAQGELVVAGGRAFEGSARLVDAPLGKEVKLDQADQAAAKNAADAFGRAARREEESAGEANELRKKMLDRLEQLLQSEHQLSLAMIQRA